MHQILFYDTNRAYGCFSNFSRHAIAVDGVVWPTSEHFFQAAKFTAPVDIDAVLRAPTPFAAAQIGRERQRSFRGDWDAVRDAVMLQVLQAKFSQHADLQEILISTADAHLVEHTQNDRYWGDGGDGTGRNMLGQLLEQVRSALPSIPTVWYPPPWIQSPDVEPSDLYWRMGKGEDQQTNAERFRYALGVEARKQYDLYFPVPHAWCNSW